MIFESWPWKRELKRRSASLDRRRSQKRWMESSFFAVEQDLFVSAFAIRKLLESKKISDEVESLSLVATIFKSTGRVVDFMSRHKIDKLYDLEHPVTADISVREFCDQLIHSFVFETELSDDGGLSGIYFSSDNLKRTELIYVRLIEIIDVIERVAEDDVVSAMWLRDPKSGESKVVRKSNRLRLTAEE